MVAYRWWFASLLVAKCMAFSEIEVPRRRCGSRHFMVNQSRGDESNRRSFFKKAGLGILGVASLPSYPRVAGARDELFKPNPLTNPLLEQIRILEQAEADDIKYGGELIAGDAGKRGRVEQYPELLVPILKIDEELRLVDSLLHGSRDDWREALKIMKQSKYDKIAFKKIFNAFGDNIYYGDPDRANLYLGGGATPKSEQSLAYLLRNEMLTSIEALRAELEYLVKEHDDETEDLYKYSFQANSAMADYLRNVSPFEMKQARELLASERS